jgi:5'-phosphate synthase pdxT subunit
MAQIGILAIQGDFDAHGKTLDRIGASWRLVKKQADLETVSGLIIPGGESTTFLKILEDEGLFAPLRKFAESNPVFGTCAGAILLADQVENPPQPSLGLLHASIRRNAYGRQLSSSVRQVELDLELEIGPEAGTPMQAVLIRAPMFTATGADVRVLARADGHPVLVRQAGLLAGTFHPELTADTRIHRYFVQMALSYNGIPAAHSETKPDNLRQS